MVTAGAHRAPRKWEVVVLALDDLQGTTRIVDTEDIAVRAHELAAEAFSWRKRSDQIDLDSVRISLSDAAKGARGRLVEGSLRTGWTLTDAGVSWLRENGQALRAAIGTEAPRRRDGARVESRKRATERSRLQRLDAWARWLAGDAVPVREAAEVFRIDSYTDPRIRGLKARRGVELLGDDDRVGEFVKAMAETVLSEGAHAVEPGGGGRPGGRPRGRKDRVR